MAVATRDVPLYSFRSRLVIASVRGAEAETLLTGDAAEGPSTFEDSRDIAFSRFFQTKYGIPEKIPVEGFG